jgi:UDP-N-acetylmuramoyl-tripeptide--D-alanyl-D-alanine ligase
VIALSVDEVRSLATGTVTLAAGAEQFTGLEIDSRRCKLGDLFVAIGRGRDFVGDALAAGAAGALVPDDAFVAMAALGRAARERSSALVVGITGSTGKTSTKDILAALCRPHARTVAAEASHNNEIGLPLTLTRIDADTEIVVLELAMRGMGQIAELAAIAEPDIGVITSIGPAHLELVATLERVAEAKAELVAALPPGGTAVVPADEALLAPHLRKDVATVTFGEGGDVRLAEFRPERHECELELVVGGEPLSLRFNFTSRHNAENALAAVAAYQALGLPLNAVQEGARDVVLSRWREEEHVLDGDVVLLNDCYNANPMSMRAALVHLRERGATRRLVAVLGGMAELGPSSSVYHREIGEAAARAGVDVLLAVGSLALGYLDSAEGVTDRRSVADVEGAIAELRALLRPGDCVLVKGSRALGLEAVADALLTVSAS